MKHFKHEYFMEAYAAMRELCLDYSINPDLLERHGGDHSKHVEILSLLTASIKQFEHMVVDLDILPAATKGVAVPIHLPFKALVIGLETESSDDSVELLDEWHVRAPPSMLVIIEQDTYFTVYPFTRLGKREWLPSSFVLNITADGERAHIGSLPGIEIPMSEARKREQYPILDIVVRINLLVNCSNVTVEKNKPSKMRVMRAKRKGQTLKPFSVIKLPAHRHATSEGAGGHHASPALHTRRGHYRTIRKGTRYEERIWVRSCLVGDPARGKVEHEYVARKGLKHGNRKRDNRSNNPSG